MKTILTSLIKVYWRICPAKFRRQCIFRETCSHYVYRVTKCEGFIRGVKALSRRFKTCRPNYTIIPVRQEFVIILADGTRMAQGEAAAHLIVPYLNSTTELKHFLFNKMKKENENGL